jgi:hypothetical protein
MGGDNLLEQLTDLDRHHLTEADSGVVDVLVVGELDAELLERLIVLLARVDEHE